jgi:regulator of protease activity HflC (stomatin/prohibitin superfamily)
MNNETTNNKKKKPNLAIWIPVTLLALWLSCMWITKALSNISQPDSTLVVLGVLMLTGWLGLVIWQAPKLFRKFSAHWLIMVSCLMLTSCERINAGYAGIKVNNYGTNRGVQDIPLVTGAVWYNPFTQSVFEYPCFVQTAQWGGDEALTFNLSGGIIAKVDVSLSYQLVYERVPQFYVKFRSDRLDTFTHGFMRNIARDAFNEIAPTYTVEDMYSEKKEEMMKKVKDRVNSVIDPIGAHLEQFGFLHAMELPPAIVTSMNQKAAAIQNAIRVENELRATKAEAAKRVASAQGEADSNAKLSASITPELIQWRSLNIQEQAIQKWNGIRPMVESGTGGGLILQIPAPSAPQPTPH